MCYTSVIINKYRVGENGFNILINMISSHHKKNKDGYAIMFSDFKRTRRMRTLNFSEFIDFVLQNKHNIMNSRIVHLHLRLSTNIVTQKFVHLWKISDFYCSHNGMLYNNYDLKKMNDSLLFFTKIQDDLKTQNMENIKTKLENVSGFGRFILSNPKDKKLIVIAYNCECYLQHINDNLIVTSSKYTINDSCSFEIDANKKIKCFGFSLTEKRVKKIHSKVFVNRYASGCFSNKLIFYDLEKRKVIKVLDIEPFMNFNFHTKKKGYWYYY